MISAGIDIGGKNAHVVILKDDRIVSRADIPSGINKGEASEKVFDKALKNACLKRSEIECVVATGSGSKRATFARFIIPQASADAKGVHWLTPSGRTIIDIGAEKTMAIKISAQGKVLDLAINEKCAAGTGTFLDAMARALEVSGEEMAQISLKSTRSIPMNAQCAVFGESEVISLIHQKVPKYDIARAVHEAIARRLASVARIIGLEKDIVLIGGVAKNAGFIDALERDIHMDVVVPDHPDYVGALGAALVAATDIIGEAI